MNCTDFIHRYSDYDDSLLSSAELELFSTHLGRCPRCARYDRVLRKGRMLARQLPRAQPSRDFVPRLQQRLHQLRRERRRRSATPVLGGAAAALAAVTVMLTALWMVAMLEPAPSGQVLAGPGSDATTEAATEGAAGAVSGGGGAATLPAPAGRAGLAGGWPAQTWAEVPAPKGWASSGVDHRVPVAYSPLVTGPPAYRVAGAVQANASISTPHPPD